MTDYGQDAGAFDAIIIGAGVIGASVALGLSRRGLRTLNVDALPAAGYGSTSNSSAIIRPFYSAVESCALAHESRHHWVNWETFLAAEDERGYAKYIECGMIVLMAGGGEAQFAPSIRAMEEMGVPFERLGPEELQSRLPTITLDTFGPPKTLDDPAFAVANGDHLAGGILVPEAGFVTDPQLAAHNLQRAAEALGASFRFNTRVTSVHRHKDRAAGVVTDAGDKIEAPVVVNVAGPHSSRINDLAGVVGDMAMTTRPMRHEVAHVPAPERFEVGNGGLAFIDPDTGVYARPEIGGHMLIGTIDPPCDGHDYVDADDYNGEMSEQWTRQVWRAAQRFPDLGIPNTAQGVVGLYDVTEDWIPIYDKSSLPGYYMAIGTSGNQFKNAPMVGALMAELIQACEGGHDHDAEPVRFRLPHLGKIIDLGFFSRNRSRGAASTGTVLA